MELGVEPAERRHQVRRVAPARADAAVAADLEEAHHDAAPDRRVDLERVPLEVEHADRVDLHVEESLVPGDADVQRAQQDRLGRVLGAVELDDHADREPHEVLVVQGEPSELHRQPEDVVAGLDREQRSQVTEQDRRVPDGILGEEDVADRTRGQPLAQRVGVRAPVDADDAADADQPDPVAERDPRPERGADHEHPRAVTVDRGGDAGQLVDAERGRGEARQPLDRSEAQAEHAGVAVVRVGSRPR